MLDMLVSFVFWVINLIANLILSPLMGLLSVLVGGVSPTIALVINSIFQLFAIVDNYVLLAIDLLCIPRTLFLFVFTIVSGVLTYVVLARIYILSITIYNHFKP